MARSRSIPKPASSNPPEPAIQELAPTDWRQLLDPALERFLADSLTACRGDEGTLWMADVARGFLVPIYNSGPHASRFVGSFRQPLSSGLISMVMATEQPFLENDVPSNRRQSRRLDRRLAVRTTALLAAPVHVGPLCLGVLSCVQIQPATARKRASGGFTPEHLAHLQHTAHLVGRLLHHAFLLSRPQRPDHA